jgi:hypothetical protein
MTRMKKKRIISSCAGTRSAVVPTTAGWIARELVPARLRQPWSLSANNPSNLNNNHGLLRLVRIPR